MPCFVTAEELPGDLDLRAKAHGLLEGKAMEVYLERRDGKWVRDCYGFALGFTTVDQIIRIDEVVAGKGDRWTLNMDVVILADPWKRRERAKLALTVAHGENGWSGSYKGRFRGETVDGNVSVIQEKYPLVVSKPDFRPLKPGEHPRLTSRRDKWAAPNDPTPTEQGKKLMRRALGQPTGHLAVERGEAVIRKAMLYDRAYWDAPKRLRWAGADHMARMAEMMLIGGGGGWNPSPWSNWQGRWRAGGGVAALACIGDECTFPIRPSTPDVREIEPARKYDPGRGVPVSKVDPDRSDATYTVAGKFLVAGPLPWGKKQNYLKSVGGVDARPQRGTKLSAGDTTGRFSSGLNRGDSAFVDLSKLFDGKRDHVLYLYSVLEVPQAHVVKVTLPRSGKVWLNGKLLRSGDTVELQRGTYPILVAVSNRGRPPFVKKYPWRVPPFTEVRDPREILARWRRERKEWEDNGRRVPGARELAKRCALHCRRFMWYGIGEAGFNHEGEGYSSHTMDVIATFANAYYDCLGVNIVRGTGADWIPLRYKAIDVKGRNHAGGYGKQGFWPGRPLIRLMPDDLRKGLDATTPAEFPNHCVRDRQKASYVFRNRWKNADDCFVIFEGKGEQFRAGWNDALAGTFRLYGLGTWWALHSKHSRGLPRGVHNVVLLPDDNIQTNLAGTESFFAVRKDGSATVTVDMDDVYLGPRKRRGSVVDWTGKVQRNRVKDLGIRGCRAMAVDFSGKAGCPAVVAMVDRITGAGGKVWQMHLPEGVKGSADGRTFTLSKGGATLKATFVAPRKVDVKVLGRTVKAAAGKGDDGFLVVMTLQKGDAPAVRFDGHLLKTPVAVGGLRVRFDGRRLLLGDWPGEERISSSTGTGSAEGNSSR
jgi:hypothetical protein